MIGSDNGLSPGRHQAIIRTNVGIMLIGPFGTNFSEILIEILTFSFKKMYFESIVCEMAVILSRSAQVADFSVRNNLDFVKVLISLPGTMLV